MGLINSFHSKAPTRRPKYVFVDLMEETEQSSALNLQPGNDVLTDFCTLLAMGSVGIPCHVSGQSRVTMHLLEI